MRFLGPATAAFLLLIILGLAARLNAHGIGKPQVLNEPAGPYLLSAWTDPDPLREDEAHVVIAVSNPDTQEMIVEGVEVTVRMTSLADPSLTLAHVAGTDNVNRLLFAVEFNDEVEAGRWRVDLGVSGDRGAGENISFEVDIEPARGFNWLWVGVGGLAAIVLIWLASSMRGGQRPRRDKSG